MKNISLILLSAGESSRFKLPIKKQWLRINDKPLWLSVVEKFQSLNMFQNIILTAHKDEVSFFRNFTNIKIVAGGNSRQNSIKNALSEIDSEFVMISDIARCFIPKDMIFRLIENIPNGDIIVPFLPISDTVVFDGKNINREHLKIVQTPQISTTSILKKLIQETSQEFTDESSLFFANGFKRFFVSGDKKAEKLTYISDITSSDCFQKPVSNNILIGNGFDVHQFEFDDSPLKLGGVEIKSPFSFKAHSDGDVLIHSLIDSILGASGIGDIGEMFPDNDEKYRGADSVELLKIVLKTITNIGLEINNIDITVMAEIPRLKKYKMEIREKLSQILDVPKFLVNVKATTTEKLGFIGRKEGVAVLSSVSLKYINWRELINEL